MLVVVVVERMVEVVASEVVVDVAAGVDTDDGQSKRLKGDDANDGRCKKESDIDRDCKRSAGRHKSERERNRERRNEIVDNKNRWRRQARACVTSVRSIQVKLPRGVMLTWVRD